MTIKILELCLILGSSFKEFVEFSLGCVAQLLKLRLQTKPSLNLSQSLSVVPTATQARFAPSAVNGIRKKNAAVVRKRGTADGTRNGGVHITPFRTYFSFSLFSFSSWLVCFFQFRKAFVE